MMDGRLFALAPPTEFNNEVLSRRNGKYTLLYSILTGGNDPRHPKAGDFRAVADLANEHRLLGRVIDLDRCAGGKCYRGQRSNVDVPRNTCRPLHTDGQRRIHDLHLLRPDRKSTRLNSSHTVISYAVFC